MRPKKKILVFPVTLPTLIFGPDPKSLKKIFLFLSISLHYICMHSSVKKMQNLLYFLYIPHTVYETFSF